MAAYYGLTNRRIRFRLPNGKTDEGKVIGPAVYSVEVYEVDPNPPLTWSPTEGLRGRMVGWTVIPHSFFTRNSCLLVPEDDIIEVLDTEVVELEVELTTGV